MTIEALSTSEEPIRMSVVNGPSEFEEFKIYPPSSRIWIAAAFVRQANGDRIIAQCIDGGIRPKDLPTVVGLDGTNRFVGPVITSQQPDNPLLVMAAAKFNSGNVYIVQPGKNGIGRFGIYDTHINPFVYIDEQDKSRREEAAFAQEKRKRLEKDLKTERLQSSFLRSEVEFYEMRNERLELDFEQLRLKFEEVKNHTVFSNEYEEALFILGLKREELEALTYAEKTRLFLAIKNGVYRFLHPDRFRETEADYRLRSTSETILKRTMQVLDRVAKRFDIEI